MNNVPVVTPFLRFLRFAPASILLLSLACIAPAAADNVDELVELYQIREDVKAQHEECLKGAVQALEMDLQSGFAEDEFDIERGDPDWALLGAIYSEYYASVCSYLKDDFLVDFYREEIRKRFTSDEIDALIEFNKTPLGRKMNDQWFLINREYGAIVTERQNRDAQDAQRRFERRMDDFWEYRQKGGIGQMPDQDA